MYHLEAGQSRAANSLHVLMNGASGNAPILRCEPIGSLLPTRGVVTSWWRGAHVHSHRGSSFTSCRVGEPGTMSVRVLELIFFFYFASHIPITLLIDLQALLPGHVYPQPLKDLLSWYAEEYKDPMMLDPPVWFKSFIFCESLLQTPFFPIAAYAFLKGGCKWIRTPAIVYSTHVATTLVPILAHILFYQFPMKPHPGPQTVQERWLLVSIYAPYLLVPVLLLLTMLLSTTYNSTCQSEKASAKTKKKN